MLPVARFEPGHAVTAGLPPGRTIQPHPWEYDASKFEIGPVFYVDDPAAKPFATYTHNGKCAGAAVTVNGATSLYLAIPYLDSAFLRSLCRAAGVHLYADEDAYVDANANFLTLTTTAVCFDRELRLPRPATVFDIRERRVVARNAAGFPARVAPLTTGFYFFGTDAEVEAFAAATEGL